MKKIIPPTTYQGGKQRIAGKIIDLILSENDVRENTRFLDFCCGSGAVSLELISRGFDPRNVYMIDSGPWGIFWSAISTGAFSMKKFMEYIRDIPSDISLIKTHVERLSRLPVGDDACYVYLVLQAASFGGKSIWIKDGVWKNTTFRNHWFPTEKSNRKSPVNPMMPMPASIVDRVEKIIDQASAVNAVCGDASLYLEKVTPNSLVYIDPPYMNGTSYGVNSLDYTDLVKRIHQRVYVSESTQAGERCLLIDGDMRKGGISGDRKESHLEYLCVFNDNPA